MCLKEQLYYAKYVKKIMISNYEHINGYNKNMIMKTPTKKLQLNEHRTKELCHMTSFLASLNTFKCNI